MNKPSNTTNQSKLEADDSNAFRHIGVEHELPSDRRIALLRERSAEKGQFGIRTLLGIVLLVAVICALPEIFQWDREIFWLQLCFAGFMVCPMVGFAAAALAKYKGFSYSMRIGIAWSLGVLAATPFTVLTMIYGIEPFFIMRAIAICWLPQIVAIGWTLWLFRKT